ncbi:MAG: hypothetical protein PHF72_10055, partial [Gammaproteobacteria bacterium]|nr:hypothetical protein [Gammaproteobacteria bacterium]
EEGSTEEGSTEEGGAEEGSTEEGSAEEGSTEEGGAEEALISALPGIPRLARDAVPFQAGRCSCGSRARGLPLRSPGPGIGSVPSRRAWGMIPPNAMGIAVGGSSHRRRRP